MRKRLALAGFPAECDECTPRMIQWVKRCSKQDREFSAVKTVVVFCPINMNQHDVGIRRDIIILLMQSNTAGCFRRLSIRHPWFELFMRLLRLICFQPKLQKIQALVEVSRKYLTKQMLGELFLSNASQNIQYHGARDSRVKGHGARS